MPPGGAGCPGATPGPRSRHGTEPRPRPSPSLPRLLPSRPPESDAAQQFVARLRSAAADFAAAAGAESAVVREAVPPPATAAPAAGWSCATPTAGGRRHLPRAGRGAGHPVAAWLRPADPPLARRRARPGRRVGGAGSGRP